MPTLDPLVDKLFAYVRERHFRSFRGIEEARAVSPERFAQIAHRFLAWLVSARGEDGLPRAVDDFVQYSTDVNLAQARYEQEGKYPDRRFAEVYATHYDQDSSMSGYLWGIYLANFLWSHHFEICLFFQDRFLSRLGAKTQFVELAPGHGGWGAWALDTLPQSQLVGFDVSRSSIEVATGLCRAAGLTERARFVERDVLIDVSSSVPAAEAAICSFLVEHLESPSRLFEVLHTLLQPYGLAFVTAALTAAQIDHIFEFRRESEVVRLCEDAGFRVLETLSAAPRRVLPRARFLPRSMALVLQKRGPEIF